MVTSIHFQVWVGLCLNFNTAEQIDVFISASNNLIIFITVSPYVIQPLDKNADENDYFKLLSGVKQSPRTVKREVI